MTPDQRETHCGDSGVKLEGTHKQSDPRTIVASLDEIDRILAEPATDPWEEQGCD